MQVLTDEQWADLAPLIEDVRPKGKTPPRDLRRTIEALKRRFKLWRHDNGARWRALPSGLGPWHRAAQLFIRWAKPGVWQRLLDLVPQPGVGLGMVFMDG
ncbi:MAG: transposase, partial [Geminicoccaceae bacterium]|nr:transposase [Geminicoccaceae bacterium]